MDKINFFFNREYQSINLVQRWKTGRKISKVIFATLVIWIIILLFVPWQQTSMGLGHVIAYSPTDRRQNIDAPVEGRLGRWYIHEGSHVEEGDPIAEITDNDPQIMSRLSAEKYAVQARLNAAQIAEKTAQINLDRQKLLMNEGLSSKRSYELAKLEHAKYLMDEANSRAELVRIETRLARQSTQFVKAPRRGIILRRVAGESSVLIKAGQPLATLVPDTDSRAIEMWIEGNDVALIHEGQKVRIQFEGWPVFQLSGWPSASIGTFAGTVALIDAADNGEGRFRILINPDPTSAPWPSWQYLRQGIRAQGWILMGRVKLGYELWRRFNRFPPLPSKPTEKAPYLKK